MLRKVLRVLNEYDLHANESKLRLSKKEINFLGYDLVAGCFSLDSQVAEQREILPKVSSRAEIRKVLGIFNVVRIYCLDPAKWVLLLHKYLKDGILQDVMSLRKKIQQLWDNILRCGTRLCLERDPLEFHLMVDWTVERWGYALFGGHHRDVILVGVNSKSMDKEKVISFLGNSMASLGSK